MPDKQPQDWTADEPFWNEAWTDMERQLDQEMPTRSRRGIPFWYWLAGSSLLLAVVLSAFFNTTNANIETATEKTEIAPLAPSYPQVKTEGQTKINGEEVIAAMPTEISSDRSGNEETSKPVRPDIKSGGVAKYAAAEAKSGKPLANGPLVKQETSATTSPGNVVAPFANADEVEGFAPQNERAAEATKAVNTIKSIQQLPIEKAILASAWQLPLLRANPALTAATETGFTRSSKRSVFLTSGLTHGSNAPGLGGYGGLALENKLGEKGKLTVGLSYYSQREAFTLETIDESTLGDVTTITTPDSVDMIIAEQVVAYRQDYDNLRRSSSNYFQTTNLRLSLGYGRQLGERWSLNAAFGVNYLLKAKGPLLVAAPGQSQEMDDNNAFVDLTENMNRGTALSGAAGGANLGENIGLNRLRYDFALSVGYRLSSRWELTTGLRTYVSPLLNSNFRTDRFRMEAGVRFRLGN